MVGAGVVVVGVVVFVTSHALAPASEYVPAAQSVHVEASVLEYFPAGHCVHCAKSCVIVK